MVAAHAAASSLIVVVAGSESVAKRIESYLRNAGHALRTAWVTDLEDVEETLRRGTPDLLICADALPAAPLPDVLDRCRRLAGDLPVLVLAAQASPENSVAALALGARDCVACDDQRDLRRLELVVLREIAVHRGVRELRTVRKQLRNFESRHQELLSGTNDAVAHIQEGIVAQTNPAFAQMLGHVDDSGLIGLPLMDLVIPAHQPKVKEQLKLLSRGKTDNRTLDCCLLHREGQPVAISARLTISEAEGEQLIEMLIRAEAPTPAVVAAAPSPSGRLAFFEALKSAIAGAAQRQGSRSAVLLAVEGFAQLELQLGLHDAEQSVLLLHDWLQQRLGEQGQTFRFSSGELAALVQLPDAASAQPWTEALIADAARQIFNTSGHEAQLSLSAAVYPFASGEQAATIVSEITAAARRLAVQSARQVVHLGPTAQHSLHEREHARQAETVRKALAADRLKLAYQSIASLEGDPRQHFDVLVRLIDEEGRELHASEFIQAAEKSAQMRAIDRWVTARALKMQAKRGGAQQGSSLFVKLSEETLGDNEGFIAWLGEQVRERPLQPGEIVFEFQELVLQNHVRKAKLITRALIDLGAQVAVEHFGIGSNSAQMIEHIPMQFVKFHPSYAKNFNDREWQKKLVMLVELAKQKQLKVIVSHIEDANVMARLWQMGVNFIQGYHVQEPEVVMLAADFVS